MPRSRRSRSSSEACTHRGHGTEVIPTSHPELVQLVADALLPEAGPAWLVGGSVRDLLLGRPTLDVDVIVSGSPERGVRALLAATASVSPRVGCARLHDAPETWRVVVGDMAIDLVPRGPSLEGELRRRDLTINAMAVPLHLAARGPIGPEGLIDPTGGLTDLKAGVVRAVGPRSLPDDPLRALRVARFAATLGFEIEPHTREWTRGTAPSLMQIAGERIAKEFLTILGDDSRDRGLALLRDLGCLEVLLPELAALEGMEQGGYHHLDALDHSLEVVRVLGGLLSGDPAGYALDPELLSQVRDAVLEQPLAGVRDRRAVLALAALLHDIGKAPCRVVEPDGRVRFTGHEAEGASMAGRIARRLRLTGGELRCLQSIVRLHMRPCMLGASGDRPTARALGRLLREAGCLVPEVALVALADRLAARGPATTEALMAQQAATVGELLGHWRRNERARKGSILLVTGSELMGELGLAEGPLVGALLAEVAAAAAAGEVSTRQEALDLASGLLAEMRGGSGSACEGRVDGQV